MWIYVTLIVVFSVLLAIWIYKSFANFIDGNEMALRVLFGRPDNCVYGHLRDQRPARWIFVPWLPVVFKCYLKKYPTDMYDLDYDTIQVMSMDGKYPARSGKRYKSVEVSIDGRAYLNFPREREMLVDKHTDDSVGFIGELSAQERNDLEANGETTLRGILVVLEKTHPLIKIFRAGVPTTKPELQDRSEEAVTNSIRSAQAQMTWKEANENMRTAFKRKVEEGFLDADGALVQMGFRPTGIKIVIQRIDLPPDLKEALTGEEAAPHVANRESIEVGDSLADMVEKQIAIMSAHDTLTKEDRREIRKECLNQLTRDRTMKNGGKLVDTRVASADGSPFAQGSLSEIIGGVVATVAASWASKDLGSQPKGQGNPGNTAGNAAAPAGRQRGGGLKSQDEAAQDFFDRHGIYPKWDPQKRTPN